MGILGSCLAVVFVAPLFLLACLPYIGLLIIPAVLMARRARALGLVFALAVLYGVYSWARSVELLGLVSQKRSWWAFLLLCFAALSCYRQS